MISFQPYANPTYFLFLGLALLPLAVGLYFGKRSHAYETIISAVFLFLTFGGPKWQQGVALLVYIVYQYLVVWGYSIYRKKANRTFWFVLAVIIDIIPLAVVKITPAVDNGHGSLIGFLGISYLTFKSVQMIMETRDGTIKEFHPVLFGQFLLFFPTISSGPIDRYRRFIKDYNAVPDRDKYLSLLEKGIHYIFLGFLYKFVLSYFLGTVLVPKIGHLAMLEQGAFHGTGLSWYLVAYMYVWSMDLFFDFSGYSLFAVGTSYIMGIETPMNFNKPFISHNMKDFWNRWHMTLSFWFRDFIFMRLTFFIMKKKLIKSRVQISQVAYLVNFLVMGFWHGVTWYYITYGIFHALAIIINDIWLRFKKKHKAALPSNKLTEGLAIFLTFNLICFSFLIFSGFLDQLWFK